MNIYAELPNSPRKQMMAELDRYEELRTLLKYRAQATQRIDDAFADKDLDAVADEMSDFRDATERIAELQKELN